MQDNWLHEPCFWKRARKAKLSEATIRGFEALKWDDQELIRKKIGPAKKAAAKKPTPKAHIPTIDTAKSSRALCFKCEKKFENGAPKIHLKGSNFHPECIKEMGVITVGAEKIKGFEDLDISQQKAVEKLFGNSNKRIAESSDAGKITSKKAKNIPDVSTDKDKAALKVIYILLLYM
uniref:PARP-type domain-containing protein n=1 Tax=Panagrolaimus superbus TaxID=310955 RepID=A0A914XTC9_9BILA